MRAAVLERFGQGLAITEVPDPKPGLGEVTIRTRAAALCRTDIKVVDGVIASVVPPIIPGHELAGEVAELGVGVIGVGEGDRVLASLDFSCGDCAHCREGRYTFCSNVRRLGLEVDGAFAELVRVPAANLYPIPDGLSFTQAATIPDAVAAPYHAVVGHGRVRPAHIVAVYGLGGLGLSAVQIARICGARVIAIARTPERRVLAEELGAVRTIDPRDAPISDQILDLTSGVGVHAFFDFVGIEDSFPQAVQSTRKGGIVVVVGYVAPEFAIPTASLILGEIAIVGSRTATRVEIRQCIDLVAAGQIRPIIDRELPLEQLNQAVDALRAGRILGRAVITFP